MIVGVPTETFPGETRVALVPASIASLARAGFEIVVEAGAGSRAGYTDTAYVEKGAKTASRAEIFASAGAIFQVRTLGANPVGMRDDLPRLRAGQFVVGLCEPLSEPATIREAAGSGATCFAMELIPRITRAQSMDALSSMATVAGYKAALLAATALPKMFPMLMTAAGTVTPAKVLVVGAGVAGLQAISTARRLGAVVHAYDVRPAVKEQVESLGARFVELPLETAQAEDRGGYARAQDDTFYRKQRELMARVVAEMDVVILTAAVPGKKAPVLVTADMVARMASGAVIVDLAAERGGNCELTRPAETIEVHGVRIMGPVNLAATVPFHASQMYAKNVSAFALHVLAGEGGPNLDDEIARETLLTSGGDVVHPRVREMLGLQPAAV